MNKQFKLEDLIGLHHSLFSPKLIPKDSHKCSMLGLVELLESENIDYIPLHEINKNLDSRGIILDSNDKIEQALFYLGTPLLSGNYDQIQKYLERSKNIVYNELGKGMNFEIKLIHDTKNYSKESHGKEFLCSSLYQCVLIKIDQKEKDMPPITIPLMRISPYIGMYYTHGTENKCEYIILSLDENLLISSFSEVIHSLVKEVTIRVIGEKQNLEASLVEETFVEGLAEYLFDKHRNSLGVPRSFILNTSKWGRYSLSSTSKKWIEINGIKKAWNFYQNNPLNFLETIKATQ